MRSLHDLFRPQACLILEVGCMGDRRRWGAEPFHRAIGAGVADATTAIIGRPGPRRPLLLRRSAGLAAKSCLPAAVCAR